MPLPAPFSLTVDRVDNDGTERTIRFVGGNVDTKESPAAAMEFVNEIEGLQSLATRLFWWHWLAKDPSLNNDNVIEGKTITIDASQNIAIVQIG